MKIPILTYHKVDTKFEFGITRVSPGQFERQIKFLSKQGYKGITVSEARGLNATDEKFVCITFDDGYEDVFHYAFPILKRYGFRATVFVISNFVGKSNDWDFGFGIKFKHLNWDQIKILFDNGWEIGSHSANHRALTLLDDEDVKFEVGSSKYEIEKNLGTVVKSFAPPFSRYDENIVRIAFECGYEGVYVLTNGRKVNGVYHRFAVYTIDSTASLKRKIGEAKFEKLKLNLINSLSEFTVLINYAKNKIFHK
ncbi:Peptidoglycan/xylan/chitin deacetylase, PgdA/CDA1 family [Candidatus Thermokryptus mobilis]|uniref:Peptidoglycan/xylan/chitin deacetylase, PgdA/CDA1 family n=1 Tax=Candidatus Thermokryptus mobilis TaxID=1643428 RepID=A0A0S4N8D1_9BACT|nr:polysaccharide deacetylase family protein [Candidatus Thermokryptus mobilis]CUU07115.1 Peptidoglycan/xylan/chitin deacetylase, PgdA/CDA1 family [Candidatus Thermokryptus mobilis]